MNPTDLMVRKADDLLTTRVDGEIIGMSIDRGVCYGFNAVATRTWDLLVEPHSLDSLCARLVEEFEIDEPTCREQTAAFLEDLRREGLIGSSEAP